MQKKKASSSSFLWLESLKQSGSHRSLPNNKLEQEQGTGFSHTHTHTHSRTHCKNEVELAQARPKIEPNLKSEYMTKRSGLTDSRQSNL